MPAPSVGLSERTSRAFADFAIKEGMSADNMGVATSVDFYDALTGGPLCGKKGGVLVLANEVDTANAALPATYKNKIATAYIFGGPAALSNKVLNSFSAATGSSNSKLPSTTRLAS